MALKRCSKTDIISDCPSSLVNGHVPIEGDEGYNSQTSDHEADEVQLQNNNTKIDPEGDVSLQSSFSNLVAMAVQLEIGDPEAREVIERFRKAETDGTCNIKVNDFLKHIWKVRRNALLVELKKISYGQDNIYPRCMELFPIKDINDCPDSITGIYSEGLQNTIKEQTEIFAKNNATKLKHALVQLLQNKASVPDASYEEVDGYFDNLKRRGPSGNVVMEAVGESETVPQGQYKKFELSRMMQQKGKILRPVYGSVTVTWDSQAGHVIFPSDFDGVIPKVIATAENLQYYDCSFADDKSEIVTMVCECEIDTFDYKREYLEEYVEQPNGDDGPSLERHSFPHMDRPLFDESGVLVLGKFTDRAETTLHLTGFYIPKGKTVYIPGNVIHTNNYLLGEWTTMLSGETPVQLLHLVKGPEKKTFHFSFPKLNI